MAITFTSGDLFESDADALVNAVNCVGVMGAGLAAAFRTRFPAMNEGYVIYCQQQRLKPGEIHVFGDRPMIFNVATKDHYMHDSRYEWIEAAIKTVAETALEMRVRKIAMPALGCGLGGLDWMIVKMIIEDSGKLYADLDLVVYEPFAVAG